MGAIRVDAQESDSRTGMGGWFPELDSSGVPIPVKSRWFALEERVTKKDFPWIYERGDTPSRVISALEALGVLLALHPLKHRSKITVTPTITDNRGNGAALNKLMTSRYPTSAILMEMSVYMKRMGIKALVEWAPREGNRHADALANGSYEGFDPALRDPSRRPAFAVGCSPSSAPVGDRGRGCLPENENRRANPITKSEVEKEES